METPHLPANKTKRTKFKSYYVVWKLSSAIQSYTTTEKFKSYYVVWKLFPTEFYEQ